MRDGDLHAAVRGGDDLVLCFAARHDQDVAANAELGDALGESPADLRGEHASVRRYDRHRVGRTVPEPSEDADRGGTGKKDHLRREAPPA
jgi:hypothetical protein